MSGPFFLLLLLLLPHLGSWKLFGMKRALHSTDGTGWKEQVGVRFKKRPFREKQEEEEEKEEEEDGQGNEKKVHVHFLQSLKNVITSLALLKSIGNSHFLCHK